MSRNVLFVNYGSLLSKSVGRLNSSNLFSNEFGVRMYSQQNGLNEDKTEKDLSSELKSENKESNANTDTNKTAYNGNNALNDNVKVEKKPQSQKRKIGKYLAGFSIFVAAAAVGITGVIMYYSKDVYKSQAYLIGDKNEKWSQEEIELLDRLEKMAQDENTSSFFSLVKSEIGDDIGAKPLNIQYIYFGSLCRKLSQDISSNFKTVKDITEQLTELYKKISPSYTSALNLSFYFNQNVIISNSRFRENWSRVLDAYRDNYHIFREYKVNDMTPACQYAFFLGMNGKLDVLQVLFNQIRDDFQKSPDFLSNMALLSMTFRDQGLKNAKKVTDDFIGPDLAQYNFKNLKSYTIEDLANMRMKEIEKMNKI